MKTSTGRDDPAQQRPSSRSYMLAALEEAKEGLLEGGVPIGAVLEVSGDIVGRGRNRLKQLRSVIRHAEMDCIENIGPLTVEQYARSVLYTTLAPCEMCGGMMLLLGIPKVVVGDDRSAGRGAIELLSAQGIQVEVMNEPSCIELATGYFRDHPEFLQSFASVRKRLNASSVLK